MVAGLKGVRGGSRIAVLDVAPGKGSSCLVPQGDLAKKGFEPAYPEFKSDKRNPVWSVVGTLWQGIYRLMIGCGDGQIWDVRLKMLERQRFQLEEPTRVGRLGAPVQALSLRLLGGQESPLLRVVAGASDGTVVAFQTVRRSAADAGRYATLWAAREESAITRIHLLGDGSGPADGSRPPMVLVVTRRGQGALFSDCSEVEPSSPDTFHRARIPGEQMGRFDLGPAPLVSALWSPMPDIGSALAPPEACVAIATGEGTFRQLSLHYPLHTQAREVCYKEIRHLWQEILGREAEPGYLLRQLESVHAAVPELPTLLARRLLEGSFAERDAQFLPKHFRCLRQLHEEWMRPGKVGDCFLECLRAAHSLGDRDLYREILEVVLKQVNREIVKNEAPDLAPCAEILGVLEQTRSARFVWGSETDVDMRIALAQSLFDGRSLVRLGLLGEEKGASRVLERRVNLVQQLLDFGDLRVAQETLPASCKESP